LYLVSNDNLNQFWSVGVADTVLSFIIKLPLLVVLFYFTIKELATQGGGKDFGGAEAH